MASRKQEFFGTLETLMLACVKCHGLAFQEYMYINTNPEYLVMLSTISKEKIVFEPVNIPFIPAKKPQKTQKTHKKTKKMS